MANVLPYHQMENDLVLSLKYLNTERSEVQSIADEQHTTADRDVTVTTKIREYHFDNPLHAVYVAESHLRRLPENWEITLSHQDLILADAVLSSFRGVAEEWAEQGRPLNWYKQPQPNSIAEIFDKVEWQQQVPAVAGEIMSCLVRKHPLPNANHRTAVAFMRTYLQSMANDPDAEFPPAGTYDGEWFDWAKEYVYESKRLLLLRRKSGLLRFAKNQGVDIVRRKGGIEIDLSAHDFGGDMVQMATTAHRNRCIQFARELISRSEYEQLLNEIDDGKAAFVDRLS